MQAAQSHAEGSTLAFVAGAFALVGVGVVVAGPNGPFALWGEAAARAFFATDTLPTDAVPLVHASLAILGGSITGKWIAAWFLVRYPLASGAAWARTALGAGLLVWLVVDVAVSVAWGAWFNVWMIDLLPLAAFGVPLLRARAHARELRAPPAAPAWRVLTAVCAAYAIVGVALPLVVAGPLFAPYRALVAAAWFGGTLPDAAARWLSFAFGLVGATFAGHFVMLWWALRAAPGAAWALRMVAVSVGAWFVVDSAGCLLHGAAFNVLVVNVPCLVSLAVPWALAWRAVHAQGNGGVA